MTSHGEEEEPLLSVRCLAVVLREKRSKKREALKLKQAQDSDCCSSGATDEGKKPTKDNKQSDQHSPESEKSLFDEFLTENKRCHWNPHLEESVQNLKCLGHLYPHTVLLGGRDIYLDTIRGAWGRKVLRPPPGYAIQKLGKAHRAGRQKLC